ncbi:50S ribosomal protein L15 [uncultured Porphyromonas sp.]|uniref:50S ribosomal protein L15 n=1 Tax=uncultured Porphyromonas sp. TaxID=159274 RepID=UPI00262EC764|nr:50S ribosomal protein L15 [uncultured Porphyromonas sp.]
MDLSTLKPAEGSVHSRRRIGRGQGSGRGGTSTRGHKGAKSRSGYKHKVGFEGGQMPIQRRLPKFGFNNINRIEYRPVNLAALEQLAQNTEFFPNQAETVVITKDKLVEAGLASRNESVKILAQGELTRSIQVEADAYSARAKELIEAQGGSILQ